MAVGEGWWESREGSGQYIVIVAIDELPSFVYTKAVAEALAPGPESDRWDVSKQRPRVLVALPAHSCRLRTHGFTLPFSVQSPLRRAGS